MITRRELFVFCLGVLSVSCAGAGLAYYGVSLPDGCYAQGKLLANDPKDDLPLSICAPDAAHSLKCPIMLKEAFDKLVLDKDTCHVKLIACEQRCPTQ